MIKQCMEVGFASVAIGILPFFLFESQLHADDLAEVFIKKATFVWSDRGKTNQVDGAEGKAVDIAGIPISLELTLAGTAQGIEALKEARRAQGKLNVSCQWFYRPEFVGLVAIPSDSEARLAAEKKFLDTPAGEISRVDIPKLKDEAQSEKQDFLFDWTTRTKKLQELPPGQYEVRILVASLSLKTVFYFRLLPPVAQR